MLALCGYTIAANVLDKEISRAFGFPDLALFLQTKEYGGGRTVLTRRASFPTFETPPSLSGVYFLRDRLRALGEGQEDVLVESPPSKSPDLNTATPALYVGRFKGLKEPAVLRVFLRCSSRIGIEILGDPPEVGSVLDRADRHQRRVDERRSVRMPERVERSHHRGFVL